VISVNIAPDPSLGLLLICELISILFISVNLEMPVNIVPGPSLGPLLMNASVNHLPSLLVLEIEVFTESFSNHPESIRVRHRPINLPNFWRYEVKCTVDMVVSFAEFQVDKLYGFFFFVIDDQVSHLNVPMTNF
jgi:hypothetical protein